MNPFNQAEFERTQRNIELGLPAGVVLSPISRRAVGQILDQLAVFALSSGLRAADAGPYWPGSPDATTEFPQRLLVDHVRVYSRERNP